ncbi:MAG: histidine phosphatase family protein [Chloroflexota bacterium]
MKTILLLRHAKSDWGNPSLVDFDRPLAPRGLKDAPRMGAILARAEHTPDLILSSPAKRARQTSELIAEACGYQQPIHWEADFYDDGSDALIAALQRLPQHIERPLLVGHNPVLEETVAGLLGYDANGWSESWPIHIPTAGLVCLEVDLEAWADLEPGDASLHWFLIPKLVKAIT